MTNNKKFKLPISEEVCNYLQKLSVGVDARLEVINKIFSTHAYDTDSFVLESIPFKKYHSEFEEMKTEFEYAKKDLTERLKPLVYEKVGKTDVKFNWNIVDFVLHEVEITVVSDETCTSCQCSKE